MTVQPSHTERSASPPLAPGAPIGVGGSCAKHRCTYRGRVCPECADERAREEGGRLEFVVTCPTTMTLGAHAELEELLRTYGQVDRGPSDFLVAVTVNDIAGHMGDFGPSEWARHAAGLPETRDLHHDGEGAAMLNALALDEWWTSLGADVDRLGADIEGQPSLVTTAPAEEGSNA